MVEMSAVVMDAPGPTDGVWCLDEQDTGGWRWPTKPERVGRHSPSGLGHRPGPRPTRLAKRPPSTTVGPHGSADRGGNRHSNGGRPGADPRPVDQLGRGARRVGRRTVPGHRRPRRTPLGRRAEVEYPPGSVCRDRGLLARPDVVGTHRVLVLASLAVDLAVAAAVGAARGATGGRRLPHCSAYRWSRWGCSGSTCGRRWPPCWAWPPLRCANAPTRRASPCSPWPAP